MSFQKKKKRKTYGKKNNKFNKEKKLSTKKIVAKRENLKKNFKKFKIRI